VRTDTGFTEMFDIITGVPCTPRVHTLNILVSSRNRLHNAESHEWSKHGIKWTDSSRLTDLDFADDLSLLAETRDILQEMTTNLETEAEKVGLRSSCELQSRQGSLSIPALATDMDILCGQHCDKDLAVQ